MALEAVSMRVRSPHRPTPHHSDSRIALVVNAPGETRAQLFAHLDSSEAGLSSNEAQQRLADVGPNEPGQRRRGAALGALLTFLANPLVLILLAASGVSALLGDVVNAVLIALMVLLSVLLNFFQTYRSQRAAERLRDTVA